LTETGKYVEPFSSSSGDLEGLHEALAVIVPRDFAGLSFDCTLPLKKIVINQDFAIFITLLEMRIIGLSYTHIYAKKIDTKILLLNILGALPLLNRYLCK
jgi:hypothetical protein